MADKASRGLVFYVDGAARRLLDGSHPYRNLNSFASRASCGFLSLPSLHSETEDKRIVREFLELLDASEDDSDQGGENNAEKCRITLSERFMGMKLALITNSTDLKAVGGELGLTVYQLSDFICDGIPTDDSYFLTLAPKLLSLLGFQEGRTLDTCPFDVVLVHINHDEKNGDEAIQFANKSIGAIMHLADQGSGIGSRLHTSVVMSYGCVRKEDDLLALSVSDSSYEKDRVFQLLSPKQSYFGNKGYHKRHHCPMLIAQLQDGVTRKDLAHVFSFKDFKERGGMLAIPADRFIHEVAFKLWKAPKYGA